MRLLSKVKLLILLLLVGIRPATAWSQQYGLNFLYNFTDTPSYIASQAWGTYADTNNFILYGGVGILPNYNLNNYIASFDYSGNLLWKHNLGFPGEMNLARGLDAITKIGKDYIIAGSVQDYNYIPSIVPEHPFLYRFKANGDSIFYIKYVDSLTTTVYSSICADNQNHVICAGITTSKTMFSDSITGELYYDSSAICLVKYDTLGNAIWNKQFFNNPNGKMGYVHKICISNDNQHYFISGALEVNPINGSIYQTLMKTDTSGNIQWTRYLPCGYPSPYGYVDVVPDRDGGCYFTSTYSKYPPTTTSAYEYYELIFGKVDASGDTVWTKHFNRDSIWAAGGNRIAVTTDGNLIISGYTSGDGVYTQSYIRPILLKTDTLGNIIWYREKERIHFFAPDQKLETLSITPSNKILQAGYLTTDLAIPGYFDTTGVISWVVLSDSMGLSCPQDTLLDNPDLIPTSINTHGNITKDISIKLYPNPASQYVNIETGELVAGNYNAVLTDAMGRHLAMTSLRSNEHKQLDLSNYSSGLYFIEITDNNARIKTIRLTHY